VTTFAQVATPITHQTAVYDRALHPELFRLLGRRAMRQNGCELEAWLIPMGHVLRFNMDQHCVCELVNDHRHTIPAPGLINAAICDPELDFETLFPTCGVAYITTLQSEQLVDNIYLDTIQEMADYAAEVDALQHAWDDEHGANLSLIDVQHLNREVHVQAFHLRARCGTVLRSQTIFECR